MLSCQQDSQASYHFHDLIARFRVRRSADGADRLWGQACRSPGGFGGVEQVIHRGILSIRPVMAPQVVPQIRDRVQLRGVRRQADQRDVRRADQVSDE